MSTLKADTIQSTGGGAATLTKQSASKVWMNLDGTGTIAVQGSLNVSSVVDNGTGQYTPSLSNSMSNVNYAGAPTGNGGTDYNAVGRLTNLATGSFKMLIGYTAGYYDNEDTSVIIAGDLA